MKSAKVLISSLIAAALLSLCMTSCTSTKVLMNCGMDSDDFMINESGNIFFGKPGTNSEDIYITGYLDDASALNTLKFMAGSNTKTFQFNGKITIDEIEYFPDVIVKTEYLSGIDTRVRSIYRASIDDIDTNVAVADFELLSDGDWFCPSLSSKEMPYYFAEFVTEEGKYKICCTQFLANNEKGNGHQTPYQLFSTENQLFQITDQQGELVAEFDSHSYKIFSNYVDVDSMKAVIACFVIVGTAR